MIHRYGLNMDLQVGCVDDIYMIIKEERDGQVLREAGREFQREEELGTKE